MNINSTSAKILISESLFAGMSNSNNIAIGKFLSGESDNFPTRYGRIGPNLRDYWLDESDRTKARYFHGLIFMQGWAKYISLQGDDTSFKKVTKIVEDWFLLHPYKDSNLNSMAYHDETTAQRLNIILGVILAFEKISLDYDLSEFRRFADDTAALLMTDEFHSGLNNHGMFQDIALRNYAVVASWSEMNIRRAALATSSDRLGKYFLHAFTSEGVHVENTPTYHLMVARSLKTHVDILRSLEAENISLLNDLLNDASDFATNIMVPSGSFPPISDTTKVDLRNLSGKIFDSEFDYSCSAGQIGTRPEVTSVAYPKSGYAIYRSDWDDKSATYLLFQAAYNNDYHKHSDDLSIVLYSAGREILTDPGPYSYNYKDPFSKYAYSQFAHNNIVIDGTSLPRTDDKASTVRLTKTSIDDNLFSVVGENGRFSDTTHTRQVDVSGQKREETITVVDTLITGNTHEFTQHWNIGEGLEVVPHGNGFEVFDGDKKLLDAKIESSFPITLSTLSGAEKPKIMGWTFPSFGVKRPANVVCIEFSGQGKLELKVKFELSNFNYVDRRLAITDSNKWERYTNKRGLNYLEIDSSSDDSSAPLVFVFTAMAPIGDFSYNYKATLDKIPAHCFYIMDDFGDQGSYYLQEKNDRSIFETVQSFITEKMEKHSIQQAVYFLGTSKGATAALLHGLMFEEAQIFIGAPQTKIGSFLQKPHPNILHYMNGDINQDGIQKLDEVLFEDKYFQNRSCRVSIAIGLADHHYKNHVIPWYEEAKKNNFKVDLITLDGTPHSEIGKAYRRLLAQELKKYSSEEKEQSAEEVERSEIEVAGSALKVGKHNVWFDKISQRLFASCEPVESTELSFRLYKDNLLVKSEPYGTTNFCSWFGLPAGKYRIRFFRRSGESKDAAKITSSWVHI